MQHFSPNGHNLKKSSFAHKYFVNLLHPRIARIDHNELFMRLTVWKISHDSMISWIIEVFIKHKTIFSTHATTEAGLNPLYSYELFMYCEFWNCIELRAECFNEKIFHILKIVEIYASIPVSDFRNFHENSCGNLYRN